ncbi:50S ribosomal protein L23 [Coprothermobacter platensis]|jgi:large subunit ribosomal protein L23|uniref:50S ribosomal protein L23 n=1 Tax=Coprothermobacter platensis TaxID=108819 RepID=UPI000375E949|nr:50S ribosomal protein L23 [Coprothermobacter platensis]
MAKAASDVLIGPVLTEKALTLHREGKYTFYVRKDANKVDIKKAVEQVFNVKVSKVYTLYVRGKQKRRGYTEYRTSDRKKAVVQLVPGQHIELIEGV